jgi:hypothetical protein
LTEALKEINEKIKELADSELFQLMSRFQQWYSSNPALGGYSPLDLKLLQEQFPKLLSEENLKKLVEQGLFIVEFEESSRPKLRITDKGWQLKTKIEALSAEI